MPIADRLKAAVAGMRHGREYPFAEGDQVHARDDWGPAVDALRIYAGQHPGAVLTVREVTAGGWLALQDETGRIYGGPDESRYGATYFQIAGDCIDHFPAWPARRGGTYACLRCDEVMPELTRLHNEAVAAEAGR